MAKAASRRPSTLRNDYRCSMERNQGGKYCVRVRVQYPRHAWNLGVFFLASSSERDVPAFVLGPIRRGLAELVETPRLQLAGD